MNLMLYLGLNKQVSSTYHFALEQSMAEIKNNVVLMYGIWSKNIDLALINKKMVAIFFCFVSEGSREVE